MTGKDTGGRLKSGPPRSVPSLGGVTDSQKVPLIRKIPVHLTTAVVGADTDSSTTVDVNMNESNSMDMRRGLNGITAVIEQAQVYTHELDTNSFPVHLVKATLSHAFLALNGDIYIRAEDIEQAFGLILRFRTRQQLATSIQ